MENTALNSIKYILNKILGIIYFIFCLVLTLFILFSSLMFTFASLSQGDYHILLFTILSIIIVLILWSLLFIQVSLLSKFTILGITILFSYFLFQMPVIERAVKYNMCIDTGVCAEGIKTVIDDDLIEINRENCLKYGKEWVAEYNLCYLRDNQ